MTKAAPLPVSAAADIVAPEDREIAARLPDDLRIVIEGTGIGGLLLIAVGLLLALALGVTATEGMLNLDGQVLFVGGGVAALAWLVHRDLVRRRREFRLDDGGITVEVTPLAGGPPRVTHVPWTDIEDYTVHVDHKKASLRVLSVRGYTLTLLDRPPHLSTREFIRRFVERADGHPRAVPPQPRKEGARLPDVTGEHAPQLGGCLALLAFAMAAGFAETMLGLSTAQEMTAIAVVGTIFLAIAFWMDLDDPELAGKDAESDEVVARLRRWLRRVLKVRAD